MGAVKGWRGTARDDATVDRPELTPHQQALDEWQRALWRRCGLAIGHWLYQRGRLSHRILQLTEEELEGMAWAAIAEYGNAREERRKELNAPPAPSDPAKPDPLDRLIQLSTTG